MGKALSLKLRLMRLLLLLALPGVAVIFFEAYLARTAALDLARQQSVNIAQQLTLSQKRIIASTKSYLQYLATVPAVLQPSSAECGVFLASVLKLNNSLINVGVPRADGELLCNAMPLAKSVNVFDRPYFQQSLLARNFAVSKLQFDRAAQKTSVNFSYPVISAQTDKVVAVAVAVVSLDWWSRQLQGSDLPENSIAIIADTKETVVASYPQRAGYLGEPRAAYGLARLDISGEQLSYEEITGPDGIRRAFTSAILYHNERGASVSISVGIPFATALRAANWQYFQTLLIFLSVILVVTAASMRELRRSILTPLRHLRRATRSLEEGTVFNLVASAGSSVELIDLQQSFMRMAKIRLTAEEMAKKRSEELSSVFKTLPDQYLRLSDKGEILDCKGDFSEDVQWQAEQMIGLCVFDIFPAEVAALYRDKLSQCSPSHQYLTWEYYLSVDHGERVFEARMRLIEDSHEVIVVLRNISERKMADAKIWQQAHYDSLTTLPNSGLLQDRLRQAIIKSKRTKLPVAVIFLDLDHFKDVNDTLGHSVGDQLLKEAAGRILTCVREVDTVARQGGDEFSIVLCELKKLDIVETIVAKILSRLAEPFYLGAEVAHITASIGITFYPNDAADVADLLKNADQAMYKAKHRGRNCFSFFTRPMQREALSKIKLLNDLRSAVQERQFILHYQPIVCLQSSRIEKAEALIRWQHPTRGMVGPVDFIAAAEESRMIIAIGDWVFTEAISHLRALRELFSKDFQISINTSPLQFSTAESGLENWMAQLQKLGLPGSAVTAEITESLMMDTTDEAVKKLRDFSEAGIQVAIDDFGTGYSSLAYIKEYDVDYLKIDQSFVRDLTSDSDAYVLCEVIVVMAHKLGIKVIAEGIETVQQRDLLLALGCDYGQGYFFSEPLEITEFKALSLTLEES